MKAWSRIIGVVLGIAGVFTLAGGAHAATAMSDAALVSASVAHLDARAGHWGIRQADQEFRLHRIVRDSMGKTHVRLNQVYQGVPVFGRQLIVHFDRTGTPRSVNGAYLAGISLSTTPVISAQGAVAAARQRFPGTLTTPPTADLVVYPASGGAQLAYRVLLDDEQTPKRVVVFVDALSGTLIHSYSDLRTLVPAPVWPTSSGAAPAAGGQLQGASGPGVTAVGNSLYSGTVSIETTSMVTDSNSLAYTMVDGLRGRLSTSDMYNLSFTRGFIFRDPDNVWGNGATSDRASAGVDAHFGAEMTWDYYLTVHGRNGIYDDGVGSLSRVHYKRSYNNAFWSDSCKCMTYGDGDGSVFSPLTSLDVAGHEMTHGVTSATAALIYNGESGGLNEAMSDIFGTMVEFYAAAHGATKTPNYLIGEDIYTPGTPGDALRYMNNPTQDGHSIDNYNAYFPGIDVHYSSGIANVAFYLLAEGGLHPTTGLPVVGIGRSAAERIFYLALTDYMVPSETFSLARCSTHYAATDLFEPGSQQVISVGQAWDAVAVPVPAGGCPPPPQTAF